MVLDWLKDLLGDPKARAKRMAYKIIYQAQLDSYDLIIELAEYAKAEAIGIRAGVIGSQERYNAFKKALDEELYTQQRRRAITMKFIDTI
jgi:hypothetical protein